MQQLLLGFLLIAFLSSSAISWWQIVLMLIGGGGCFVYALYKYQEGLLFQPVIGGFRTPEQNPPEYKNPGEKRIAYEDVRFKTVDGETLSGWFIPAKHTEGKDASKEAKMELQLNSATILYFHANAGNMGFRMPFLERLHDCTPCNIFIISYRGYGHSTGTPSEGGVYKDADASLSWLIKSKKVHPDRIVLFGRSLGGAVAINLASRNQYQIKGLILENTFTSISDIADKLFPFLFPIKPFILRLNFPSLELIKTVQIPILFVSGQDDEIVPTEHMQALWDAAKAAPLCRILRVPGGKHNNTWMEAEEKSMYFDVLKDFISTILPDAPKHQ
mmetsp:Transcript_6667/g.11011  ORF Transcript_6667/g.11011 Transcript_6667/m.11011 type:complete len:331 (-) Transcript_6667:272-1264(-)|eukprot:jgi/Bigna1/132766/aug1.19_g7474